MINFLSFYACTVIIVAALSLLFWIMCLMDDELQDARKCLTFVPKSVIWPHYLSRIVVRQVMRTMREGK